MYGINKDTNLDDLVGQTLEQVCIGLHDMQLKFSKNIAIVMQCEVIVNYNLDEKTISPDNPSELSFLAKMLGKSIIGYYIDEPYRLTLVFCDEAEIVLVDSNREYESYVIWIGGSCLAV